jgi:branched-chain amino acid transport system ATP-binding protein
MSAELTVDGVTAGYGETVVLDQVSFSVPAGGSLAVLGRNGVGKTTLMRSLMGLATLHGGRIAIEGRGIERAAPFRRNRLGLGYVPQERDIFPSLSVEENLAVARRAGGWSLDDVLRLFPSLRERRRNPGGKLSGGEQQMLAIGRALVGAPKILLLDEPMEGLAPVVVDALYDALCAIRDTGRATIVLVEQKAELALRLTQRAIVLDRGRIIHQSLSADLIADAAAQARLLAVDDAASSAAGDEGR